ncbi:hypothetical protein ACN6A1_29995 [Myxococcus virescens]|uniref:hypothetical protein n=1 Tax=Myxococcus virescens TaxID=83456 RepID=UPI003DA29234
MSTQAIPEKKALPGAAPTAAEVTVFLKPSFGITIQRNTLCVSVSARARPVDTVTPSDPRAVDDSIGCP